MHSVRIDKWLWAARFFKTRALASKGLRPGRIHSNDIQAKPAREVRVGDMLRVRNEGGEFHVEVLQLSEMRGPAAVAQTLYRETEASKAARAKAAEERKAMQEFAPLPEHRPSKRDRRRIIQFRGRWRRSIIFLFAAATGLRGMGMRLSIQRESGAVELSRS